MVIISAAICDKSGKLLLARLFHPMTKSELESTLKNFPKSLQPSQQHTFIENNNFRFLYLPLDEFYLILLTNKGSNIIEDLECLRVLQKVVGGLCGSGTTEENILKNSFDILLAFDDCIVLGFRESVTPQQIQTSLEMESSEEKLHLMLMKARMNEAKENAKKHQMEIKKGGGAKSHDYLSASSATTSSAGQNVSFPNSGIIQEITSNKKEESSNVGRGGGKKGMQLGKKKEGGEVNNNEILKKEILKTETKKVEEEKNSGNLLKPPVLIQFEEKINCGLTKEGVVSSFEVIGDIYLTCRDKNKTKIQVALEFENNKQLVLKPHPTLNRTLFTENKTIALKEGSDGFTYDEKVPTVKYRYVTNEMGAMPFNFTYWMTKGNLTLELEYNVHQDRFPSLEGVILMIPYPAKENPNIKNFEFSEASVSKGAIYWKITKLDKKNVSSNIEITYSPNLNEEDLFPIEIMFEGKKCWFDGKVVGVNEDGRNVGWEVEWKMNSDNFRIS